MAKPRTPRNSSAPAMPGQFADESASLQGGDYEVLSPLVHDGQSYGIGDTVSLTPAQRRALPVGVVA